MSFSFDSYVTTGFGGMNDDAAGRSAMKALYQHNFAVHFRRFPKDAAILDVGCGMGQCVEWLVSSGYIHAKGIDPSPETVAYCTANQLPVECVPNTTAWLESRKESYDILICNDVIEHISLEGVIAFTQALYGALKPGGMLIMKTNNVSALTGARMRYWDITHTTSYTEFSLGQLFGMAGIAEYSMQPFTFPIRSLARLVRAGIRAIVHTIWKLIYWSEYTLVPRIVHEYFFAVIIKK